MQHDVPFDVAFALDDNTRIGWGIIISEQQSGKRFNWKSETFEDRK